MITRGSINPKKTRSNLDVFFFAFHLVFHTMLPFLFHLKNLMKAFVFDTETTGFTVKGGTLAEQPYIIQFAGILGEISKEYGFVEIERIDQSVKPRISIPFAASQVNGIYDRDVVDAPYIEEVID